MNKLLYLENVIMYIEENLSHAVTPDQVAQEHFVSLMQLYRDFYAYTGYAIKEYIRRRRLSKALNLVKDSSLSLVDIAYCCGYSSQQAFCKQVKTATGYTPLQYQKSSHYYHFPPYRSDLRHYVSVGTETIPYLYKCSYYDPQKAGIEDRAIAYALSILPNFQGRLFGQDGNPKENLYGYDLYMTLEDFQVPLLYGSILEEITYIEGYTATYATTLIPYDPSSVQDVWDYLYTYWLQGSMFVQGNEPLLEEYILKHHRPNKLKLYLPVYKRPSFCAIEVVYQPTRTYLVAYEQGTDGENRAAAKVLDYIKLHQPHLLTDIQEYIVQEDKMVYMCGSRIPHTLVIDPKDPIEILTLEQGYYATLRGSCCNTATTYYTQLNRWLEAKGSPEGSPIYAIYDTSKGTATQDILLYITCRIES